MRSADCTQRWYNRRLISAHCPCLSLSNCHSRLLYIRMLHSSTSLELFELVENVAAVVARLAHAFIEIVQSRVRHLKGLIRDSCDAA